MFLFFDKYGVLQLCCVVVKLVTTCQVKYGIGFSLKITVLLP